MTDWAASTDIDSLVFDARKLWERGRSDTGAHRVELYLKRARRRRMSRGRDADRLTTSDSIETGCALRWVERDGSGPRHLAIVGASDAELSRAIGTATSALDVDLATFAVGLEVPDERLDVEPGAVEPDDRAMSEGMRGAPWVDGVELGRTVEVLVGSEGWIAVRTRVRSSAVLSGGSRLVARRGPDVLSAIPEPARCAEPGVGALHLAPPAAAAVVARLVATAHGSSPQLGRDVGPGWVIADDPHDPRGLAGGEFDDAGFPTRRRPLARDGKIVAGIDGSGAFWRRSFRDPPRALPSTLVVDGGGATGGSEGRIDVCRVLPLSRGEWVLELSGLRPRHVRTTPDTLLLGCRGGVGAAESTADGVITPGLIFENVARD